MRFSKKYAIARSPPKLGQGRNRANVEPSYPRNHIVRMDGKPKAVRLEGGNRGWNEFHLV